MRRRAILEGAGTALSVTLAGCGGLIEPMDNESEESPEQNNTTDKNNEDDTENETEPASEPSDLDDDDSGNESEESVNPATLIIDDFEDYDSGGQLGPWTLDGNGTVGVSSSAALHEDSSQGIRQNGDSNIRSFPGQGLPNYPEDGRVVSVLMRPDSNTSQPWILLGMEDNVWATETTGWRLIVDPNGGIRIARETENGVEILDKNTRLPNLVDRTVNCQFVADSSKGVAFRIKDLDGTVLGTVSTSVTDGIADEMSIGFRSSQGVDWDRLRFVDSESDG